MNRTRAAVERLARQPVPTADQRRRAVLDSEPDRLLHEVLDAPRLEVAPPGRGPGRRRWKPVLAVGVAVTAVLAAVAVFLLPGPAPLQPLPQVAQPPAPTTEIDSAEVLGQLAALAAAQPPLPPEPFDYLHIATWATTFDDKGYPVPVGQERHGQTESWVNADGLGRQRHVQDGGEISDTGTGELVQSIPVPRMTDLPTDPAALEAALLATRTGYDVTHLYDLMIRTWYFQVLDPQVNTAFLRLLATKDDVRVIGQGTDRLGRQGVEVTLTAVFDPTDIPRPGPPTVTTHTLILDPQTGAPLGDERVETIGGEVASRNATAWLGTGRVGSIDERP